MDHISFSRLPVEFESHCLWGLHPRNESRVGLFINNKCAYEPPKLNANAHLRLIATLLQQ